MAKINIAYDISAAANNQKAGIGYYSAELLSHLAQEYLDEVHITAHYFNFLHLKRRPELPVAKNITYRVSYLLPQKLVNVLRRHGIELPFELLTKQRSDVHIFPNFLSYPSIFRALVLSAVHDATYLDVPQSVSEKNRVTLAKLVPETIRRSSAIITISRDSEQKLKNHYPKLFEKKPVIITYPAPPLRDTKIPSSLPKDLVGQKYILFVGTLEPRKNVLNLIAAYQQLPENLRNEYALCLAGSLGWKAELIAKKIADAQAGGDKIFTFGYVSDAQKQVLYENAALFVFPSFYEGFGIPPLEAMQANVPVVASDIAVLHEACGQAALYCDPDTSTDITKQIQKGLTDQASRKALIAEGTKQLSKFSWATAAKDVYITISRLLGITTS